MSLTKELTCIINKGGISGVAGKGKGVCIFVVEPIHVRASLTNELIYHRQRGEGEKGE